jgi:carotenoid 1,2-hydratase
MTERGRRWTDRSGDTFRVGPSAMHVTPDALTIDIDEICMPIPRRIRGRVQLTPAGMTNSVFPLDAAGRHLWSPIAPIARMEALFDTPDMRFSGHGYLDTNWGSEPLEVGFRSWTWSRARIGDRAAILYDCVRRDGTTAELALAIGPDGRVTSFDPPPACNLPGTVWRMPRPTRSDESTPARLVRTLEDAPFYARSITTASIGGEPVTALHESLSLDRFSRPIVHWMLPFRMPRRG